MNNELINNLENVINNKIELSDNPYNKYSKVPLKSHENINAYLKKININKKSVLTYIGSSDLVFDVISKGAIKVDCFDTNIYSIMFFYLKEAAIKSLKYIEFLNFFYIAGNRFDKELYEKIKPFINSYAIEFWNKIFEYDNDKIKEIMLNLTTNNFEYPTFSSACLTLSITSRYLDDIPYEFLKKKLDKIEINIYLKDFDELINIDNEYDFINLSNIYEYQNNIEDFIEKTNILSEKLKRNGKMIVAYLYDSKNLDYFKKYRIKKSISSFKNEVMLEIEKDDIVIIKNSNKKK